MSKNIGYVIIKHLNISDGLKGDDIVIETERLQFSFGEHILEPKEIEGYKNIPFKEPIITNPNPYDSDWEEPVSQSAMVCLFSPVRTPNFL